MGLLMGTWLAKWKQYILLFFKHLIYSTSHWIHRAYSFVSVYIVFHLSLSELIKISWKNTLYKLFIYLSQKSLAIFVTTYFPPCAEDAVQVGFLFNLRHYRRKAYKMAHWAICSFSLFSLDITLETSDSKHTFFLLWDLGIIRLGYHKISWSLDCNSFISSNVMKFPESLHICLL